MCLEVDTGFEEALWCKIKLKKDYLLVGVCYRSPNSTDSNNQSLLDMLDHAMKVTHVLQLKGAFVCVFSWKSSAFLNSISIKTIISKLFP